MNRPRTPGRKARVRASVTEILRGALVALVLAAAGCERGPEELVLASTTSTEDSGFFDEIIPVFEAAHPQYRVRVIAVGSGEALELGRRDDADVLLVHAPFEEIQFMEAGYGRERRDVMYNDFLIVGPAANPANIQSIDAPEMAFRKIAQAEAPFVSRGDDSGTHKKELAFWGLARLSPGGAWYMEVGQGMADALRIANERQAYTLVDRATWLSIGREMDLVPLIEGQQILYNPYAVITVDGAANPEGADAFMRWIVSDSAQALIGRFGVDRWGRQLYHPNAMR